MNVSVLCLYCIIEQVIKSVAHCVLKTSHVTAWYSNYCKSRKIDGKLFGELNNFTI